MLDLIITNLFNTHRIQLAILILACNEGTNVPDRLPCNSQASKLAFPHTVAAKQQNENIAQTTNP